MIQHELIAENEQMLFTGILARDLQGEVTAILMFSLKIFFQFIKRLNNLSLIAQ